MAKTTITFSLDTETDRDLLYWLEGLPKRGRSEAIREALRGHLEHGVSLGDVYQAVRDLERRIGQGVVSSGNHKEALEEPDDIAAALDNLGL